MASVSADKVRKRLGFSMSDVSDEDVNAYVEEAAAWLSGEISRELNPSDCTLEEANAIANLAAIYCYCHVTGVASSGWTVNLGQLNFTGTPQRIAQLEFLRSQVFSFVDRNKSMIVGHA